jgi:hypothetical protein
LNEPLAVKRREFQNLLPGIQIHHDLHITATKPREVPLEEIQHRALTSQCVVFAESLRLMQQARSYESPPLAVTGWLEVELKGRSV